MTNQVQKLNVAPLRIYTRADFAALRALVQRIAPATIARQYYDPESVPHAATPEAMERYLRTMRDDLVRLALLNGSTVLAEHLKASIRQHGSAKLTLVTLRMVEQAATLAAAAPAPSHALSLWFRPLVAKRLTGEGIATLGELVAYCNAHGGSWWRAMPRIGALRAQHLVAWLRAHAASIGHIDADVDARELVPTDAVVIGGSPERPRLAPFERLAVPASLSGAHGENRAQGRAYIRAEHDLAALHAYLHRYRDRPATLRAYTREIERFVLWTVIVRGVAVSSITVEDGEAYKDFLARPSEAFCGPVRSRASGRWRPFTPGGLSPESQRYAIRAVRAAFEWLVAMRYLAGNPWHGVTDPVTTTYESRMQVERALPPTLWRELRHALDAQCAGTSAEAMQWRIARAAILLMGDSGLRSAEAASTQRDGLKRGTVLTGQSGSSSGGSSVGKSDVWELHVIGKRRKARVVPVSPATVAALRDHWRDRGLDLDRYGSAVAGQGRQQEGDRESGIDAGRRSERASEHGDEPSGEPKNWALVAPVVVPLHDTAQQRHADGQAPYRPDTLARLVKLSLQRLLDDPQMFDLDGRARLDAASAHAFRHTFGTLAIARGMSLDVVRSILGHASLQTTSVYTRTARDRMMAEAADYYNDQ